VGTQLKPDFSNFDNPAFAVPHYYGDNPNDSETSDFAYNRAIMALGGETWFEFWRLPAWMLPNIGTRGPTTNDPNPEMYADAIVAYCKASAAKAGAPPTIVGVQNELCPSPQALALMIPALRQKLDAAGFANVKIHMANAGRLAQGMAFAQAHHQADIWPLIDFAASNIYDVQDNFRDADRNVPLFARFKEATENKDFLSVEICVNSNTWQSDSYRVALAMGQVFHQDLTLADARALIYCWLLMHVPEPSFGWTRMLFSVDTSHDLMPVASSDMLRVFGAYSRRIQRGMVRIGAESTDPDLLATAFHADNGRETVVLLNRATQPRRVTVTNLSFPMEFVEIADPYHENSSLVEPINQHGALATVEVPAGGLITLSSVPLLKVPANFKVP
jgi:O-glycosyl hydrolase